MATKAVKYEPTRLGGFDLLRVSAAIAVVLLHAAVPYLIHPLPGLVWPVRDVPNGVAHWAGWSIELIIMPLFLLMAGYFAWSQLQRVGRQKFLRNRFLRLILPLVVLGIPLLIADLHIWVTGWVIEGVTTARKLRSFAFDYGEDEHLWGLGHLWFLQYAFLYCAALAILESKQRWVAQRPLLTTSVLACIGVVTLTVSPEVVFGFQHAYLPVPSKWAYCGTFFWGGAIIASAPALSNWTRDRVGWLLAAGSVATVIGVVLGGELIVAGKLVPSSVGGVDGWAMRLVAAVMAVLAGWLIPLGLLFLAQRVPLRSGPKLTYFAAASFWVYLIHHPIVGLSHITLKLHGGFLPAWGKMLVASGVGLVFSLLTFEVFVRRWPLAGLLGTPSHLRKQAVGSNTRTPAFEERPLKQAA